MVRNVRSALLRYGLAIVLFVVIIGAAILLEYLSLKINMSLPVVLGLVIATWYGGRGPGLVLAVLVQIVAIFSNGVAPDSTVALTAFGHFSVFALLALVVFLIAGRKAAEERLEHRVEERTAQLKTANAELEAFSYSVSHDLRSPLRHIGGFSHILLDDYGDVIDEDGKTYLREIRESVEEMTKLIDDVLELSKITRMEMHRESVDISKLATNIVDDLRKMEPDREPEISIADGIKASGDARLLKIMLFNLLGNAWKFTSKVQKARIAVGQDHQNGSVVFFVRDNGAGFDMAFGHKLFDAFQRLHSAREFEGTGIGLATVNRIVVRHGGRIWAESEVDKGATFYFELPP